MAMILADTMIESLVRERMPLPVNGRNRTRMRSKRGQDECQMTVSGDARSEFRLILRRNKINVLDFSIILAVVVPQSNRVCRLHHYNKRATNTPTTLKTRDSTTSTFTLPHSGTKTSELGKTPTPSRLIATIVSTLLFSFYSRIRVSGFRKDH